MKISHINYSDDIGGASKASKRICEALNHNGVNARLAVLNKILNHQETFQLSSKTHKFYSSVVRKIELYLAKSFFSAKESSLSIQPSKISNLINQLDCDIAHLHWVNGGFLSISDIAKINKPKVWTLHDMWPFCATEHYTESSDWMNGYINHDGNFLAKNINKFIWNKKNKLWNKPFEIVAPSRWMADCAKKSLLFNSWPITVIRNPIDTDQWFSENKKIARKKLGLPIDSSLILFGSAQGTNDPRKGFEYLKKALKALKENNFKFELVIFGNTNAKSNFSLNEFNIHDLGMISNNESLRSVYQSCDVFVLPSLQDNLPNTCVESIACGTPVCAFNSGGVEDIVKHQKTGYLAKRLDYKDLAHGIEWILSTADTEKISDNCKNHISKHFSYPVVSKQYKDIYERLLAER